MRMDKSALRKIDIYFLLIEWNMIVVTVLLSILKQIEFHWVQNQKEDCYHNHIPLNLQGNGNLFSE